MTSNETQSYNANCHCGQVKLSVTLPNLCSTRVNRCNCSICTRNGYLLVYLKREDVFFLSGENQLSEYRFGNKRKPHKFCRNCGTSMLIDSKESDREVETEYLALNIRTIEDIEEILSNIEFRDIDGRINLARHIKEHLNVIFQHVVNLRYVGRKQSL